MSHLPSSTRVVGAGIVLHMGSEAYTNVLEQFRASRAPPSDFINQKPLRSTGSLVIPYQSECMAPVSGQLHIRKPPRCFKIGANKGGGFLFVKKSQNFDVIIHIIMTLYHVV